MRIAVTGANGFLGSHVMREIVSRDLDVVAVLRSPAAAREMGWTGPTSIIDMAKLPDDPYASMGSPAILIHLAWAGLPNYQSPHHLQSELPAQIRFLAACLRGGLRRLTVAGTCFEYGMASGELSEDAPTMPCTQYGLAKDSLRKQLQSLRRGHPFELAWLRLFYLFGAGQSERSLYSQFHAAVARGDTSFDMSAGEQVRDFLPVRDAVRLLVDIALLPSGPGVVNLCSGVPTTVQDLVASWIKLCGSDISMNLGRFPYPDFEPMAFWGNRKKLDNVLGQP
jgi:nucleoside-diphosphate-sugar epimerase